MVITVFRYLRVHIKQNTLQFAAAHEALSKQTAGP